MLPEELKARLDRDWSGGSWQGVALDGTGGTWGHHALPHRGTVALDEPWGHTAGCDTVPCPTGGQWGPSGVLGRVHVAPGGDCELGPGLC